MNVRPNPTFQRTAYVPYCHLVFTLPHEINALAAVHARWVYDTLMQSVAATLSEFAANRRAQRSGVKSRSGLGQVLVRSWSGLGQV